MDLSPIVTSVVTFVVKYWLPLILTVCTVEVVKHFLPDEYEKKWIPIASIGVGLLYAGLNEVGFLTNWVGVGIMLSFLASGGIAVFFDWLEKFSDLVRHALGKTKEPTDEPPTKPV